MTRMESRVFGRPAASAFVRYILMEAKLIVLIPFTNDRLILQRCDPEAAMPK